MASVLPPGVKAEASDVKVEMPGRDATSHTLSVGPGDLRDELLQAIENIQVDGTFASSSAVNRLSAGVFVHGVGEIATPLTEFQACQMIAKARQAPYGKGSETIVDTSVRNTWELDPGQFELRDPTWTAQLQILCRQVAKTLGINGTIKAELYKMLIYEKGAMFKAHTDTEKIPGMFGTLVVCLPSTHQGGDVVLRHNGQAHVFSSSAYPQSCAFWYSDVFHEVLPVTSGYRWVLTYNLALDPAQPRPSASLLSQINTQPLRQALNRWLAEDPEKRENEYFYHVLDHDYTEASISLNALKAHDLIRVQALKEECSKLPVDVYLALLEKMESGSVEYCPDPYDRRSFYRGGYYGGYDDYDDDEDEDGFHALDEVFESSHKVLTLVDLDGHTVTKGLELDEDDILQEDAFEDIEGREEYEGYMGNSGPMATHWYRVATVVIAPHDSLPSLFAGNSASPSPVAHLARRCLLPQAPESLFVALDSLLSEAWDPTGRLDDRVSVDAPAVQEVVRVALHRERYDLLDKTMALSPRKLEPGVWDWIKEWLNGGDVNQRFKAIQKGITSAVLLGTDLGQRAEAITRLVSVPEQLSSIEPAALEWARETARQCLENSATNILRNVDGPSMVDLAFYFDDPLAFLSETVAPIIAKHKASLALVVSFLSRLMDKASNGKLPLEGSLQLYRSIAKSMIASVDFTKAQSHHSLDESVKKARYGGSLDHFRRDLSLSANIRELSTLFRGLIKADTEADNLVASFVAKLTSDCAGIKGTELPHLWIPFLRKVDATLDYSTMSPAELSGYQKLFTTFLKAYLDKYVGREPTYNRSLVRPRVHCNCDDCSRLNEFLVDRSREVGRFPVNKQRRGHLHSALDGANIDCTHTTERRGSPQTLVVTKTFRQIAQRLQSWTTRRTEATKELVRFDQDRLKKLLGDEYTAITNMDRILAAGSARQPLAETPQAVQAGSSRAPAIGEKRKFSEDIDVIDLTGE
ncbi:hypothetical protein CEP54_010572 [Fusarium duplospermum]|uniref:Prolyl 4-hydroxylase alpha subunit Fe(2+) 2OG dioxygenase domain-containing protein n=1 Tax=Fusarium duplospermum TaxID=1325734 RepID=A0A428PJ53_9HYPO|nr:hypothetical protein CEP54_010572 [Fusarium duplospermum]